MLKVFVLVFCVFGVFGQDSQGLGSGTGGNLRVCVVEGRGAYRRAGIFCPTLENEHSGIECVIGTDRLDCLRRIGKGTVDFGVFSPEDLVTALWAKIDVLVTNELRGRDEPFEYGIVAVVAKSILPPTRTSAETILRGKSLCNPGHGSEGLSATLANYLEAVVTARSCDSTLSMAENRIKATSSFFNSGCKAGPWVEDLERDAKLKSKYPSLCSTCYQSCRKSDKYWGETGALNCLADRAGDITWARYSTVSSYFGLQGGQSFGEADAFALLCQDGSWQPLNSTEPCVWINKPWPVVVAKRKAAEAVSSMAWSLTNSSVTVDEHWRGALAALLKTNRALAPPLEPQKAPMDYLAGARGFTEAYSQSGCNPSRHITVCTSSNLEHNKCSWLAEAGSVYGVEPPLQCALAQGQSACLRGAARGDYDVTMAPADLLVSAQRDFSVQPILYETTTIANDLNTVGIFIRRDAGINKMADLRGMRAAFPLFDGVAWHSVVQYLAKAKLISGCSDEKVADFFGDSCAPGIESAEGIPSSLVEKLTKNCYRSDGAVTSGDVSALGALVEGRSDVAFVSLSTYKQFTEGQLEETWSREFKNNKTIPLCVDNNKYCFLSWSSTGQMYAAKNVTTMKKQEIINVFKELVQLFGKTYPFRTSTFNMFGTYSHQSDVLFHDTTKELSTGHEMTSLVSSRFPMSYEQSLVKYHSGLCTSSVGTVRFSAIVLIFSLVLSLFSIY